ncbi:hypothetical protein P7K49_035595 [Saguinus oedipus]|uniref:Uncharacterized protein n=1 Tax=Saguinus oedipus TaxID=9490 RepID=A0ABQ9TNQ9_SAGOE|nr:hypothetical protein P7K49_035595 [Saguinus oedipus]
MAGYILHAESSDPQAFSLQISWLFESIVEKSLTFVVFVGKVFVMEVRIDFTYEYIMMIKDMSAMNVEKHLSVMITLQSTKKYIQVKKLISVKNVENVLVVGIISLFITKVYTLERKYGKNIKRHFINVMFTESESALRRKESTSIPSYVTRRCPLRFSLIWLCFDASKE